MSHLYTCPLVDVGARAGRTALPLVLVAMAATTAGCMSYHQQGAASGAALIVLPRLPKAGEHDVAQTERYVLTLREGRKPAPGWRLSEAVNISRAILSPRAARGASYVVADPYFARVHELKAWRGKEAVESAAIVHLTPPSADVFLSSFRLYRIDFGVPRVGEKLHHRFQRRYAGLAFLPSYTIGTVDRVERFELLVHHPRDVRVDFDLQLPKTVSKPRIVRKESSTQLVFSDVPRIEALPYLPASHQFVRVRPRFSRKGQVLGPVGAKALGGWYGQQLHRLVKISKRETLRAKALVKGASSPMEKLRRLYDFVREEIRYVADERGENAWIPRHPAVVLARRYGDCKDKSFLLRRLAAQVGLDVELVLVSTRDKPSLGAATVWLFDHVVARYTPAGEGAEPVYLDATCRRCELGSWPQGLADKPGLVVLGGAAKGGELFRLPPPRTKREHIAIRVDAELSALSKAKASIEVCGPGHRAVQFAESTSVGATLARRLAAIVSGSLRDVLFEDVRVDKPVGQAKPGCTSLSARVDLSHYVVLVDGKPFVPAAPFSLVPSRVDERRKDTLPITLGGASAMRFEVRLRGVSVASAATGKELNLGSTVAGFSRTMEAEGASVKIVYRHQRRQGRFVGASRASYMRFCADYRGLRRTMVPLGAAKAEGGQS